MGGMDDRVRCKQYAPWETRPPVRRDSIPNHIQILIGETALTAYVNTYGDNFNAITYNIYRYHYESNKPFMIPVNIIHETHECTMLVYVHNNTATCIQHPDTPQFQPKPANLFHTSTDQPTSTTTAGYKNLDIFDRR